MKINKCLCRCFPKIGDVGGYNQCIEICCPKCNKTVTAPTMPEAIDIWNKINKEVDAE